MRIYIAGPMSGQPDNGFPVFDTAAKFLTALGHDVVNPADLDRSIGIGPNTVVTKQLRHDALARDFRELVTCDAIALLPGWEASMGATAERRIAEDIGLDVYHLVPAPALFPVVCYRLVKERPAIIVGLSGYAQAGKDTAGGMMVQDAGFTRLAFADVLKAVALDCDPGLGDIETMSLRDTVRRIGWERTKSLYPDSRIFLQHLGVAVRNHVDPAAWVNAVLRQVQPGGRYVITDVRFPNEAQAIKAAGGYVVRVSRPGNGPVNKHESETALDGFDFDAYLMNDRSIEQLRPLVRIFLNTIPELVA